MNFKFANTIIFLELLVILSLNCKNETTTTTPNHISIGITNLTATSAASGGEITSERANLVTIKKALALGNSITRHAITPFWWGNWGMADD